MDHVVASAAVTVLSVVTAVTMCRVFADWSFLATLLLMAVGVHAASIVLRIARVPGWLALPIVLLVVGELLAISFYGDTLALGFPTGDTFELARIDLRLVWSQFPTAVAPVPSEGSFLLAAALGIGLVSLLADAFAFRAFGRAEAVVPGGVLFVFTAALGTDRLRIEMAALWFAAALVVVAVLRALHGGGAESWLGRRRRAVGLRCRPRRCALVAAVGAAAIGPGCRVRGAPNRCSGHGRPRATSPRCSARSSTSGRGSSPQQHRDVHRECRRRAVLAQHGPHRLRRHDVEAARTAVGRRRRHAERAGARRSDRAAADRDQPPRWPTRPGGLQADPGVAAGPAVAGRDRHPVARRRRHPRHGGRVQHRVRRRRAVARSAAARRRRAGSGPT
ncbi:MAG: transglutaminaseTgpA domain-containing protein [Ilumatobacteraceae bacterium]